MRSNPLIGLEGMSPTKPRQATRPPRKEDFVRVKKLGKGRFGDVFLVKHTQIGFICAMKIISKQLVKQ
jgi:serine/threonine protein kinase